MLPEALGEHGSEESSRCAKPVCCNGRRTTMVNETRAAELRGWLQPVEECGSNGGMKETEVGRRPGWGEGSGLLVREVLVRRQAVVGGSWC